MSNLENINHLDAIKEKTDEEYDLKFWDWDGTLVNSKTALYASYHYSLRKVLNHKSFNYTYFLENIYRDSKTYLRTFGYSEEEIEKARYVKNAYYLDYFRFDKLNFDINPNDLNFIVSNTDKSTIIKLLKRNGFQENIFIDIITPQIDPKKIPKKPSPIVYFKAYQKALLIDFFPIRKIEIWEDDYTGLVAAYKFQQENLDTEIIIHDFNNIKSIRNWKI